MSNLYESKNYDLTFRGILFSNIFKMYTNNDCISISSEISFDINADYDENDLLKFCNTALNKSFIYNTLKHVINFDIKFILIE